MNTEITSLIIFGCVIGAVLIGRSLSRRVPQDHLNADTKETVKLAMGLLATMSALLLGLLVASAKGSYDNARNEVIQMAAKVVFLNRVLTGYGPEAEEVRARLHEAVKETADRMRPIKTNTPVNLAPNTQAGNAMYLAIQQLTPHDEMQRNLKAQATTLALDLGQIRTLLVAESISSISKPLLIVVSFWLVVIFLTFSLIAPRNGTAAFALIVSAVSVATAIFLILELDRPFSGLLRIPNEPMLNVLSQLEKSTQ
jgi:Protein of unknown function (DUF4239)